MKEALAQAVKQAVESAPADSSARASAELGAITRLVLGSHPLSRMLADPDISADAKRGVLSDLTKNAFSQPVIDLVITVSSQLRMSGAALSSSLIDVLAEYAFVAGERDNKVELLERQLYEFSNLIRANDNLRDGLSNPGIQDADKDKLVSDLLANKADPAVVELVRALVAIDHGRDVDMGAEQLSYQAAALRNLTVAEVLTAIELDDDHRRRITEALTASVGSPVEPRFSVDPSILGSVIVRIGDEVLDGSIRHRLDQARTALLEGVN